MSVKMKLCVQVKPAGLTVLLMKAAKHYKHIGPYSSKLQRNEQRFEIRSSKSVLQLLYNIKRNVL